jgi:hypothetical protein
MSFLFASKIGESQLLLVVNPLASSAPDRPLHGVCGHKA